MTFKKNNAKYIGAELQNSLKLFGVPLDRATSGAPNISTVLENNELGIYKRKNNLF